MKRLLASAMLLLFANPAAATVVLSMKSSIVAEPVFGEDYVVAVYSDAFTTGKEDLRFFTAVITYPSTYLALRTIAPAAGIGSGWRFLIVPISSGVSELRAIHDTPTMLPGTTVELFDIYFRRVTGCDDRVIGVTMTDNTDQFTAAHGAQVTQAVCAP